MTKAQKNGHMYVEKKRRKSISVLGTLPKKFLYLNLYLFLGQALSGVHTNSGAHTHSGSKTHTWSSQGSTLVKFDHDTR